MMPDYIEFVYDYDKHHEGFIRLQVLGSDGTTSCSYTITSDSSLIKITPDSSIDSNGKTKVEVCDNSLDLTNMPEIDTSVIFTATLENG